MASQVVGCRHVNSETLLQDIAKETRGNICKYSAFFKNHTYDSILNMMERYTQHKIYDSLYGDIVPLVTANAIHTDLLILSREHISDNFDFHHVKCESGIDSSVRPIILFKVGDHYDACLLQDTATKVSTNHRGMVGNISDELKRSSPRPTDKCVNRDDKSNDQIVDTDDMKNDIVNHCFDDAVSLEMSTCRTPGDISNVTGHHSPYSNENCVIAT